MEIDCDDFYGPNMSRGGTRCYVSRMPRDEVLGELSVVIEPHVVAMPWGDDYGQYHGVFTPKGAPGLEFGLATSFVKPKTDSFRRTPHILREYESDVVYTPPLPKHLP